LIICITSVEMELLSTTFASILIFSASFPLKKVRTAEGCEDL
jgi:hypothetical protein